MRASEEHITANGVSLWTAIQGIGPPVVLCHGGPGIYDYLEPVAAMIDDLVTVHRYDQRGCGRSENEPPYDITTFVADLDALRAHWGYGSWTVIGHSWGATLALMYAIRRPERVSRLVYLSGTGIDPAWHGEYRRNREAKLSPIDRERLRRLNERRRTASATELARINHERSALLARTEYYDAAHVTEIPRYDRFPINFALNAALGAEENRLEETGSCACRSLVLKSQRSSWTGQAIRALNGHAPRSPSCCRTASTSPLPALDTSRGSSSPRPRVARSRSSWRRRSSWNDLVGAACRRQRNRLTRAATSDRETPTPAALSKSPGAG